MKTADNKSADSNEVSNESNDLVQKVILALQKRQWTVSFAESCTGGQLSARITEVPGVSAIYMGSVVSYANEAKVELLGVGPSSLQSQGAVSQIVAQEMAQGVRHRFHTDWGVSITGIAGPTGGSDEKPVGTVWVAVAGPQLAKTSAEDSRAAAGVQDSEILLSNSFLEARKHFFKGSRKEIQEQSVLAALGQLLEALQS